MEKRLFERVLDMGGGYVLGFTNQSFQEFILDVVEIDIYDSKYDYSSGSKANRLRRFWVLESDDVVGRLMEQMLRLVDSEHPEAESTDVQACRGVVDRLRGRGTVSGLDAIQPNSGEEDFSLLARTVRDSIEANEPEAGLDRLHTFTLRYIRVLAEREGIDTSRSKPLHSVFGELIKALRRNGTIETEMSERILKSTISTLESFNRVRNEQSFAHPNRLLTYDEALLIFRNVVASIEFLESIVCAEPAEGHVPPIDEIPL